tara:strand:- start:241 stop:1911 length:1671 start_codon:yes stop_codon:yes gene_type:complete
MPQVKTVELKIDAEEALKRLDAVEKELSQINKTAKQTEKGTSSLAKGFKGIGLAWKAIGIGAVISALQFLADKFSANQKVMDTMNTISTATGEILVRLSNIFIDLGKKAFKAFEDPLKPLKNFAKMIKDFFIGSIKESIKGLGLMGKAMGKLFKGEFKEAAAIAKEGANTLWNAQPIVKLGNAVVEASSSIKEFATDIVNSTSEIVNNAKEITELTNKVKLAEAEQRKIQLTYQKDAELQRQLRDDTSASIDDRIAANERLGKVLEEQFQKEKALVLEKIKLRQLELAQNEENVDLQVALTNAETDLADLEERITGQRSENLTNTNSLLQEQIDKETDLYGGEARETMLEALEAFNFDVSELREDGVNKSGFWTNQEVKNFLDAEDVKVKAAKASDKAKLAAAKGVLSGMQSLFKEGTAGAKAAAMGQILIDTATGISSAISGATAAAGATGPLAVVSQPLFLAQMLGTVLSGIASAKAALGKVPGGGGGGGGTPSVNVGGGGIRSGEANIPNIENIGTTQLGEDTPTAPVQAYVVENEISNSQALQEELELQATL